MAVTTYLPPKSYCENGCLLAGKVPCFPGPHANPGNICGLSKL